jgi:formiminotetrahydrofolate cyclodeaminase
MPEYNQTATIGDFLAAAAARQPTPGGGSVAALAGALAASMGEMAVH